MIKPSTAVENRVEKNRSWMGSTYLKVNLNADATVDHNMTVARPKRYALV
jgi:hypothetical protein